MLVKLISWGMPLCLVLATGAIFYAAVIQLDKTRTAFRNRSVPVRTKLAEGGMILVFVLALAIVLAGVLELYPIGFRRF